MADQEHSITTGAAGDIATAPVAATPLPGAEGAAGSAPGAGSPKSAWLPVVVPMRARVADDDSRVIDEWPAPGHTLQAPRPVERSGWQARLTGRAAVIAAAAAIGGLVGAAAASGMGQVLAARDGPGAGEAVEALRTSIGQLAGEIKALKDGVGAGGRAAADGLASLEDRLAGAEAAQADLTAQIASLTKGLSREPVAAAAPVSPEITGSITRSNLPVASDWVLWRVRNGRALVQGNGGYFEVVPGSQLPGLGLVQRIIKENGRWMVLTRNAVIVARG
jgi:hypothetical protein